MARGNIWQHGNTARHKKMYLLRLSLKPTQTPPTRHTATLHNRSAREAQREQRSVTRWYSSSLNGQMYRLYIEYYHANGDQLNTGIELSEFATPLFQASAPRDLTD